MNKGFVVVPEYVLLLLQRKSTRESEPYSKAAIDADLNTHNKETERKTKENRNFARCRARINQ